MTEDIKTQLTEEIADTEWKDLIPHAQRDALIVVVKSLNLVDVGIAIAQDDVQKVQHWISEQLIQKPTAERLGVWNSQPNKKFTTLIVQPYVIVCET